MAFRLGGRRASVGGKPLCGYYQSPAHAVEGGMPRPRLLPGRRCRCSTAVPQALAQNSPLRKQPGTGPAPAAGEPLALQKLLRVVVRAVTRECDRRSHRSRGVCSCIA